MSVSIHEADTLAFPGAEQDRILARVGHALNNPLQVILGTAELLIADEDLARGSRTRVETIREAAATAADVVRNLVAYGRERPQCRAAVDVSAVVDRVLAARAEALVAGQIAVRRHYPPDVPLILGDPSQLEEAFARLIINAEEAMRSCGVGVLTVTVQPVDGYVRVSIADTGPGVDPAVRPSIFQPLTTTKPATQSAGLGLAVAHRIVHEQGGVLTLLPQEQPGATFVIDLPLPAGPVNPENQHG